MNKLLVFVFLFTSIVSVFSQSFSKFIGYSKRELYNSLGRPLSLNSSGDATSVQYSGESSGETNTYLLKNEKVVLATQGFTGLSLHEAKEKRNVLILFYLARGYFKQGTQDGLTILKRGQKVVSIGYMNMIDSVSEYVTLVTAYN